MFEINLEVMPESTTKKQIEAIHRADKVFVLAISGGGTQAIPTLLSVPGGSRSVLEAVVPYSASSMDEWLGGSPAKYCSHETARAMAMVALQRARKLVLEIAPHKLIGVGCTASLASDRAKRGTHRIHVATQSFSCTTVESLELTKNERTRTDEEAIAAALVLRNIAKAAGLAVEEWLPLEISSRERIQTQSATAPEAWQQLQLGELPFVAIPSSRSPSTSTGFATNSQSVILLPGSFNPAHRAHRRMAELAAERLSQPVWWELSLMNVDKPSLDYLEIEKRISSIRKLSPDANIVLTRAARFTQKGKLFPDATFVVGADTLARIINPRYYSNVPARVTAAITAFAKTNMRFLVFARTVDGNLLRLKDLDIPLELAELCEEVPNDVFLDDISSTALRK